MRNHPIRVLLLDDEESLRKPLTEYLRNALGIIVDPAANGKEALRLIDEAEGRYDVALVDEVLTEPPNGLEVLREIKARYPDIEVILFTAWGRQAGVEALRAGASRYLAKPFDKEELALFIRFAAEQKRLRREHDYMAALVETSQALAQTTNRSEQLNLVWNFVREQLAISTCFVALYDSQNDKLNFPLFYDEGKSNPVDEIILGTDQSAWGLAGYVVKTGQEQVWFTREQKEKNWQNLGIKSRFSSGGPSKSGICLPLQVGGTVVGAFSVQSYKPYAFDQALLNVIRALSNQIAVALENSRLMAETEQKALNLQTLQDLTVAINSTLDLKEVLTRTCRAAVELSGADHSGLLLFTPDLAQGKVVAEYPPTDTTVGRIIPVRGVPAEERLVFAQEVLNISDVARETSLGPVRDLLLQSGIRSIVIVPVISEGKVVASFGLDAIQKARSFSQNDIEICQRLANQTAVAIQNARRVRQMEQLRIAADAMASEMEWKDVLRAIAKSARQVLEADCTFIWPYDAERGEEGIFFPEDLVAEGIPDDLLAEFRNSEPEPENITKRVLQKGYVPVEDLDGPQAEFVSEKTRGILNKLAVKSFQGIRLDVAGERLGVLFVDYKHARGFGEEDRTILEHFANHAALTLKKARLLKQVERARDTGRVIAEATTFGKLEDILKEIVRGAKNVLNCDIVTLYTFDEKEQRFVQVEGIGYRERNNLRPPQEIARDSSLWRVVELGKPYYHPAENVAEDRLLQGGFVKSEKVRSALGIQLRFEDERVGVMFVNYRTPHRFIQDEINDALHFGHQAAVAIRNAQLHEKTTKQAETLKGLYEAGKAITSTLALEEVLARISEHALNIVGANPQEGCFSHIALLEGNKLRFIAGFPPEILDDLRQNIGEIDLEKDAKKGIVGQAVLEEKSQNVSEVAGNPHWLPLRKGINIHSQLSVPLKIGERIIGTLNIGQPKPDAFSNDDVRNTELLAAQAALAIENAQRYRETAQQLAARTALAWTGMLGSTWRHTVEKHALTIREQVALLRSDAMRLSSPIQSLEKRLSMIERLANQILEKPITPPLSAEEGVQSLYVNDFLRERTKQLWAHEPYKFVSLQRNLELDARATVRASPEWLRRALDILIDNAVEATAELPERKIVIGSQRRDKHAEILITDNGHGIPSDVLERLFREPIKKPQGVKGQGIGLLLAQMIVQTYGGTISCRETGATGTTMVISLPLEA